jgi:hypothetical protein
MTLSFFLRALESKISSHFSLSTHCTTSFEIFWGDQKFLSANLELSIPSPMVGVSDSKNIKIIPKIDNTNKKTLRKLVLLLIKYCFNHSFKCKFSAHKTGGFDEIFTTRTENGEK